MSATPMSFRLSPHTAAQLKTLCLAMGLERQIIVTMAIDRMAQAVLRDWEPGQIEKEAVGWTPGQPLGIYPEP